MNSVADRHRLVPSRCWRTDGLIALVCLLFACNIILLVLGSFRQTADVPGSSVRIAFLVRLFALLFFAGCGGPVNTGSVQPVLIPVGQPVIPVVQHTGFRAVQVCLDISSSYPRDEGFNPAKQAVADAIDAAVVPGTDGLLVYVGYITSNSWQDESSPLTIEVPKIDAFPASPALLPMPTPTGNPFTDSKAVKTVNLANARSQTSYQDALKQRRSQLAVLKAHVHAQINRLRSLNPAVEDVSTDVNGCIEKASIHLLAVHADRLLLIASDMQNNTLAERLNSLDLSGVRVKVIYHYCPDANQCTDNDAWWKTTLLRAHVKSLAFYDVAQSRAIDDLFG